MLDKTAAFEKALRERSENEVIVLFYDQLAPVLKFSKNIVPHRFSILKRALRHDISLLEDGNRSIRLDGEK